MLTLIHFQLKPSLTPIVTLMLIHSSEVETEFDSDCEADVDHPSEVELKVWHDDVDLHSLSNLFWLIVMCLLGCNLFWK